MVWYSLFISLGFGALYAGMAFARANQFLLIALMGGFTFLVFLASFLAPPQFFHFTNDDLAPRVQTQVISRAAVGSTLILLWNVIVWLVLGRNVPLLEELYMITLIVVIIFQGWAGAVAAHVVYLQQTKQYNSNQLVAVITLVTLLLFVLILFFVALDWAIPRDAVVHLRDLALITLVLVGYGRAVYLMAHH